MARAYFNFKTNLEDGVFASVDYIAFEDKNGNILSLSCNMDSNFCVENNEYNARWKGLDICVDHNTADSNKAQSTETEYNELTEETFELLQDAKPYEIQIYSEDGPERIECKDFSLEILFQYKKEEKTLSFSVDELDVIVEG